ncbi:MAG: NADH:ubiquinone reductase (Na(+)-transporting) subunit C [Bacteroidales bacterium]|nr:NADH:ubiquinone reductase (Na(+)-transporting) subunit C [Bacteroidales bacterium]
MFSNKYIYIYTTVMVVVVAALLALAATLLKPFQDKNAQVETMQNILKAAGIASTAEDAETLYGDYIREELTIDAAGDVLARYAADGRLLEGQGTRAFDISMKNAVAMGKDAELPVFVCRKGEADSYIVPLYGKGLWGPVWGYITLESDMNTVAGVSFGHQGETPGLGAEIVGDAFQQPFAGKRIFDENRQFTSVTVQKGGVKNYKGDPVHAVDAISGGTITSTGVSDMLYDCLTYYIPFFLRMQDEGGLTAADSVAEAEPVVTPEPVAPEQPRRVAPQPEPAAQPAEAQPAPKPAPVPEAEEEKPETPETPVPQPVQPEQPAEPVQPEQPQEAE